ncbi:ABC-2 type transport system permease protein [Nocardia transvalensis]|uniref:Transport permease protein n=1 Tax=Nocardia transvalensis TaxID=37333 RepID=A0A7W9P9A8_9NOCA|nr:ABC transporter permease [Nocardia transvalensis]MBB5911787.1 ABC-2 type transport system permease protein [Nocardia transvalensis]
MTFLRDTGLIFWAQLRSNLRNPLWVLIGLSQPVLYLVLFGPLVKGIAAGLGPGTDPWELLTPALVIQIGLFGAIYVGFGIVMELRAGVIERQRVTPASRGALLLGRILKDTVVLIVQALILVGVAALAFGLRPDPLGLVLSVLLIAVMGAGLAAASYALGLWARSEDTLASILNSLSVPLMLLSGILLPLSVGPTWLQRIGTANPFSHTVEAARALFRGDLGASEVYWGTGLTLAVAIVLTVLGARSFARENA